MRIGTLALTLLIVCAPAATAAPPAPARLATASAPAGVDIDLFQKSLAAAAEALRTYGPDRDPAALRRVADIGYRVAQETHYAGFPISFYLIDMAEPNAFALPGGQVFVTRGMLELGLTDDELAALLGHEVGHVVGQHSMKMERRATLLNVLSQALLVGAIFKADQLGGGRPRASDPRYPYDPNDPYGTGTDANRTQNLIYGTYATGVILSELLLRSYSRDFENEADEEGQRWAAAAGYSPTGTQELMSLLSSRLPESKDYGYWRTHPFFEERVERSRARAAELKALGAKSPEDYRQSTQTRLLEISRALAPEKPRDEGDRPSGDPREPRQPREPRDGDARTDRQRPVGRALSQLDLVKLAALSAWPRGEAADGLRMERLVRMKEDELDKPPLARDYGRLVAAYQSEIDEVRTLSPATALLATLEKERAELSAASDALYAEAGRVFASGIYETPFLETFESNYPRAAERPAVALALGEAYSRTNRQADAVEQFLIAWKAAPAAEPGVKAQRGLRNLAPGLEQLAALCELARQSEDAELQRISAERLERLAGTYGELANGAEFLRRFPEDPLVERVNDRLNQLAENLYGEVVLYQGVGDQLKALERIQRILTSAPQSPAAARILDKALATT
ncbi:MAG: M48 family metallopeptidase [Thermoanaerobaculia bacterium]